MLEFRDLITLEYTAQGQQQFKRQNIDPNADCSYAAFDMTRAQAHSLLSSQINQIKDFVKVPLKEQLRQNDFLQYLKNARMLEPELVNNLLLYLLPVQERPSNLPPLETLLQQGAENAALAQAYIDYDVGRVGNLELGWAHPAMLQALAKIRGITLHLWQHDAEGILVPYSGVVQSGPLDPAVAPPQEMNLLLTGGNHFNQGVNLLFIGDNHFETLEVVPADAMADFRTLSAIRTLGNDFETANRLFILSETERLNNREQDLAKWKPVAFNLFKTSPMSNKDFNLLKLLLIPEYDNSKKIDVARLKYARSCARISMLVTKFFMKEIQYQRLFLQHKMGQLQAEAAEVFFAMPDQYTERVDKFIESEHRETGGVQPLPSQKSEMRRVNNEINQISENENWRQKILVLANLTGNDLTQSLATMEEAEQAYTVKLRDQTEELTQLDAQIDMAFDYNEQANLLSLANVRKLISATNDLPANYQGLSRIDAEAIALVHLSIDLQDEHGDTFLHWAVRNKDKILIGYLLSRGANASIQNNAGQTARTLTMANDDLTELEGFFSQGRALTVGDSKRKLLDQLLATQDGQRKFLEGVTEFLTKVHTHFQDYSGMLALRETQGTLQYYLTFLMGRNRVIERRADLTYLQDELAIAMQHNIAYDFLTKTENRAASASRGFRNKSALYDNVVKILAEVRKENEIFDPRLEIVHLSQMAKVAAVNSELTQQIRKLEAKNRTLEETIVNQNEKIAARDEKIAAQDATIAKGQEEVVALRTGFEAEKVKTTALTEIVVNQNEKIAAQNATIAEILNVLRQQQEFTVTVVKAERGDAGAQYNLGIIYAEGRGVVANPQEAMSLWRKSAAQGNLEAQNKIRQQETETCQRIVNQWQRLVSVKKETPETPETPETKAAKIIQKTWRAHRNVN